MRRAMLLRAVVVAALLVLATAPTAQAVNKLSVDRFAFIEADGAVRVGLTITCSSPGSTWEGLGYFITQRKGNTVVFDRSRGEPPFPVPCDAAVHTDLVTDQSPGPFRPGPATVEASVQVCDASQSICESLNTTEKINLRKRH
jgi:hypothetical protein